MTPSADDERPSSAPAAARSGVGHVTGAALYTDDLWPDIRTCCTPGRCMAPHAHARSCRSTRSAALTEPGVVAVLTAADVPARTTPARRATTSRCFPTEVMFHRPAGGVGAGRDARRRRGAAPRACSVDTSRCRRSSRSSRRSRPAASSPSRVRMHARRRRAALRDAPHRLEGELASAARSTSTSRRRPRSRGSTRAAACSCTPRRSIRPRRRRSSRACSACRSIRSRSSACAWAARSAARKCRPTPWAAVAALGAWKTGRPVRVRLTRELDMALTGKRHPFLARYRRGLRRATAASTRCGSSCTPTAAGASTCPSRSCGARCSTATTPTTCRRGGRRPRLPHAQDVADRVPRLRRTAGHGRDRRHPRSHGAQRLGARRRGRPRAQLLSRRATRRTTARR